LGQKNKELELEIRREKGGKRRYAAPLIGDTIPPASDRIIFVLIQYLTSD
jgi:hypothetical protein